MNVKTLRFSEPLEDIPNIYDDNIEVVVTLENQREYVVTVITPQYLLSLMDRDKVNFVEPGAPFIFVRKLTKEIIEEVISAHAEFFDAYWLKYHHFADHIKHQMFEELQKKEDEYKDED